MGLLDVLLLIFLVLKLSGLVEWTWLFTLSPLIAALIAISIRRVLEKR